MDNPTTPRPRDSRLEQFATTARNIIMIERGLTATAIVKIRHLAKQQHLSTEQVETCLSQISGDDFSTGRVGRYEQLFLDRMATELPSISNAEASGVLSPMIERQAIQVAVDEYKISESRAKQLLSFFAKQHGLRQVSMADAKSKLRDWIGQRMNSREFQPADLTIQISGLAKRFGISEADVDQLIEAEIATAKKRQTLRNRWLTYGAIAVAFISAAIYLFSHVTFFSSAPNTSETLEKTEPETDQIATTKEQQSLANVETTIKQNPSNNSEFRLEDFELPLDDNSVKQLKQWQQRLIAIANQSPGDLNPKTSPDSFTNLKKKNQAFANLQSEDAGSKAQLRGLENLSNLTDSLTAINAAEAKTLAEFCLQANSAELQLLIQRKIDRLARWPRFLLEFSDQWAESNSNQISKSQLWKQRIGIFLAKAKSTNEADIADLLFAKAKLRLAEIVSTQSEQNVVVDRHQAAKTLADHVRQFIFAEQPDSPSRQYFLRLVDQRDRDAVSMQQRLELQQILIESIVFNCSDDQLCKIADAHYRKLPQYRDLSEQFAGSRRAMLELVSQYVTWREKNLGQNGFTDKDYLLLATQPLASLKEAHRLRNQAELLVIAGDVSKRKVAEADYRAAASYGDEKITRSCLRGLIGIAEDPRMRQRYVRQLDFINDGQMGPIGPIARMDSNSNQPSRTVPQTVILKIIKVCQKIRQEKSLSSEAKDFLNSTNQGSSRVVQEIGRVLHTTSQKPKPLSTLELYRIVQIEAMAKSARDKKNELHIEFDLSWEAQLTLRPLEIIPLLTP